MAILSYSSVITYQINVVPFVILTTAPVLVCVRCIHGPL